MATCTHCGAHVSERFLRVFAGTDGELHACQSCSTNTGIAEVAKRRAREA